MKSFCCAGRNLSHLAGVLMMAGALCGGARAASQLSFEESYPNPNPAEGERFGSAVAAVGPRVAAGCYSDDSLSTNSGIVYLFDQSATTPSVTLLCPEPVAWSSFGASLAGTGDRLLVGAPGRRFSTEGRGSVFLYDGNGNLQLEINDPTTATVESFGETVALTADRVVVGAPRSGSGNYDETPGAVYIFTTTGSLVATLSNPNPAIGRLFGAALAVEGDLLAVGAPGEGYYHTAPQSTGAVYVYSLSTGQLLRTISNPTPAPGDSFGNALSISGARVAVGALNDQAAGTWAGAVHVFTTQGALQQTLLPAPGFLFFGVGVQFVGSELAVGATGGPGTVFLFDSAGNQTASVANPRGAESGFFGAYLGRVGQDLLAAAPNATVGGVLNAGVVYRYRLAPVSAACPDWELYQ